MMRSLFLAAALLASGAAMADSSLPAARWANEALPDPAKERQATELMESLRCLVCQGQSIADSDAEMAGDMRALVRREILAGKEPDTIRSYLIERYGRWVSYQPTLDGATWPLWAAPIAILVLGVVLARRRFRRRRP